MTETKVTAPFPHCDQRILHAPGECRYCDEYPERQQLRKDWGIAFTGHQPERLDNGRADLFELPCPADHARGPSHAAWHGNQAQPLTASADEEVGVANVSPGLLRVVLTTGDGEFVAYAHMPPFVHLPRVVQWGVRSFVLYEEGNEPIYTEAFAFHAVITSGEDEAEGVRIVVNGRGMTVPRGTATYAKVVQWAKASDPSRAFSIVWKMRNGGSGMLTAQSEPIVLCDGMTFSCTYTSNA